MDLRRLAGDLLDRAHEDVRNDRDAKEAGNVFSQQRYMLLIFLYVDVLAQTKYRS